ncbi:MAG: N-acetyltransferase [Phycisphaerales bacterium]|nr:N-acetyltransferase [Phycisphaerales bacterium]MCB9862179.1 N-acetyltransferase [Phycisphaerales bacterium]
MAQDNDSPITIRFATPADLPAIAAIYAYYVDHSVATFATTAPSDDEWRRWLDVHTGIHPAIVATIDDRVVGWGSLSAWNLRCAYRTTVEDSVYVHSDMHRRGIGRAVLARLVELAGILGHRVVIGQIADHQAASERLHEAFGFRRVGCLEGVGYKFDRSIDVSIFQLTLPTPGA